MRYDIILLTPVWNTNSLITLDFSTLYLHVLRSTSYTYWCGVDFSVYRTRDYQWNRTTLNINTTIYRLFESTLLCYMLAYYIIEVESTSFNVQKYRSRVQFAVSWWYITIRLHRIHYGYCILNVRVLIAIVKLCYFIYR